MNPIYRKSHTDIHGKCPVTEPGFKVEKGDVFSIHRLGRMERQRSLYVKTIGQIIHTITAHYYIFIHSPERKCYVTLGMGIDQTKSTKSTAPIFSPDLVYESCMYHHKICKDRDFYEDCSHVCNPIDKILEYSREGMTQYIIMGDEIAKKRLNFYQAKIVNYIIEQGVIHTLHNEEYKVLHLPTLVYSLPAGYIKKNLPEDILEINCQLFATMFLNNPKELWKKHFFKMWKPIKLKQHGKRMQDMQQMKNFGISPNVAKVLVRHNISLEYFTNPFTYLSEYDLEGYGIEEKMWSHILREKEKFRQRRKKVKAKSPKKQKSKSPRQQKQKSSMSRSSGQTQSRLKFM